MDVGAFGWLARNGKKEVTHPDGLEVVGPELMAESRAAGAVGRNE
jgi:hypothetical protein